MYRTRKLFSIAGKLLVLELILGLSSCMQSSKSVNDFYAFYTHLYSDEAFEQYSRISEYADIVVNVREGERLVFWRGTSFLPYWETAKGKWSVNEIVPRKGDGSATMPDATNMFSTIKLIENSTDKVVVLWRYLPDFEMNNYPHYPIKADPLAFVEELFTIKPDGEVSREIRKGTTKVDDWNNARNRMLETFSLKFNGIRDSKITKLQGEPKTKPVVGNELVNEKGEPPLLSFNFDEAIGDQTVEAVSNKAGVIKGHKSLWKKGVSKTALQFDGYTSAVVFEPEKLPEFSNGMNVEAWIVLATYPWNWVPVIQQGDSTDYALGIDGNGNPTFAVRLGNKQHQLTSSFHLERNRWYHLAGSFDETSGQIAVFVNGILTDKLAVPKQPLKPETNEVRIGNSGKESLAINPVRTEVNFPTAFGFDGLIDEIRVYDKTLTEAQVQQTFSNFKNTAAVSGAPDIEIRHLPELVGTGKFRGYYANLNYYEVWDNMWRFGDYPDVVVEFENSPTKFIFWKGTNYIPYIANDKNQWYSNEFNETWGTGGGTGCQEPMSDKKLLTTSVRIVEQSDVRVVVNWRCALMDTKMNIQANFDTNSGWGDWIDWDYYIYPDGVAVKKMRLWTSGRLNHEWQEGMILVGENTHPEEVIEQSPVYFFINDEGEKLACNWADASKIKVDYADKRIFVANLKSDWDPFTICDFTAGDIYNSAEISPYSVFCSWNHWPTALIKSDGRYSSYPDRVSHSSLNHIRWDEYANHTSELAPYQEKILMEGMTNKSPEELYPLSCSWLSPAAIEIESGADCAEYDASQRAYVVGANSESLSLKIQATPENPVVNLCLQVKNWHSSEKATVKINDSKMKPVRLRQGIIRDTDGKRALLIWLEMESREPFAVKVNSEK